ncbi:hypothetical protein V1477_005722 [Vespula maculifrons]|uniref:Uncharacterized protein n=1 Tax=Vespula maculifrons TaxID=7453 RepID=A0ABD2CMV8_VESMC
MVNEKNPMKINSCVNIKRYKIQIWLVYPGQVRFKRIVFGRKVNFKKSLSFYNLYNLYYDIIIYILIIIAIIMIILISIINLCWGNYYVHKLKHSNKIFEKYEYYIKELFKPCSLANTNIPKNDVVFDRPYELNHFTKYTSFRKEEKIEKTEEHRRKRIMIHLISRDQYRNSFSQGALVVVPLATQWDVPGINTAVLWMVVKQQSFVYTINIRDILNQPKTKTVPIALDLIQRSRIDLYLNCNSKKDKKSSTTFPQIKLQCTSKVKHIYIDTICSSVHTTILPTWIVQMPAQQGE